MIPPPFDAWVLARLFVHEAVSPDEIAAVSEAFRPLVESLAGKSDPEQDQIYAKFLAGRHNRDAIIKAIADADPHGPPPAIASVPPPGDAPHGVRDSSSDWPALPEGKLVMATDRDPANFGRVIEDHGDIARVKFVSTTGYEAVVMLPKTAIQDPDGGPLTSESDSTEWGPLRIEDLPPVEPFPVECCPSRPPGWSARERTPSVALGTSSGCRCWPWPGGRSADPQA